jgi:hypothetical protein
LPADDKEGSLMLKENSPLHAAFPNQENLEIVMQAFEEHFSDLFQLDVLEEEIRRDHNSAYLKFFKHCVSELQSLYTIDEVVSRFVFLLTHNDKIRKHFLLINLFVPKSEDKLPPQLGFVEKLRAGSLQAAEPLTFIDMLRSTARMAGISGEKFAVCHLKNLSKDSFSEEIIFVNLTQDLRKTPKWCVVNLKNRDNICVYCEAPLSEAEKSALDRALDIKVKPENYLGGKADFSVSTGYTALAWVNNIIRTSALTLQSDFSAMLEEFIFTQSEVGLTKDDVMSENYDVDRRDYGLANAAILGELDGHEYELNDLTHALSLAKQHKIQSAAFSEQSKFNARSYVLGFDAVLLELGILKEMPSEVILEVPETINNRLLQSTYNACCKEYQTDDFWLNNIYLKQGSLEGAAEAMVLATFRGRARKPVLTINLPEKFQLSAKEQRLILKLMSNNAYVGELNINANRSLQVVKSALTPDLARNRWLHHNGYLPPMADNYWQRAAKYWAIYLSEHPDALVPKDNHAVFHRCVKEMGLQGLTIILDYLSDPLEREFLDSLYSTKNSGFYADCEPQSGGDYLHRLTNHLQSGGYFPFTRLGLSFSPAFNNNYRLLFQEFNKQDNAAEIYINDFLKASVSGMLQFLDLMIEQAQEDNWITPMVITELEEKGVCQEQLQAIRSCYVLLNDIILKNRRLEESRGVVQDVSLASNFDIDKTVIDVEIISPSDSQFKKQFKDAMKQLENASWPLRRGGALQLQVQQQQQIEQSRHLQIEQQTLRTNGVEEAITQELVTIENIDTILTDYYTRLAQYNKLNLEKYAPMGCENETPLQQFFHTWISANPHAAAKDAIRFMSQDAAKVLLSNHERFASGLNPDNLPRGFYTQRNKDGYLILCYNRALGFTTIPTPLTVNMGVESPKAIHWEGDFRQFALEQYPQNKGQLEARDMPYLLLFASMQPPLSYEKEYLAFMAAHPDIAHKFADKKNQIVANWVVFYQSWQYAGVDGISFFLSIPKGQLQLTPELAYSYLSDKQSRDLQEWVQSLQLSSQQFRAIGQLYYRFGEEAVALFLTKLQQIEQKLGGDFFRQFKCIFLDNLDDYSVFFSKSWFLTIDAMNEGAATKDLRKAWLNFCSIHLRAVNWETPHTLWQAFNYLVTELADMGLAFRGKEFDGLSGNMLVLADRILAALRRIPSLDDKRYFLSHLSKMDLSHGGVTYAITQENFRFFDGSLELTDFRKGTPTYAPDMATLYSWGHDSLLMIKRLLASSTRFNRENYQQLCDVSGLMSEDTLVWLHTNYNTANVLGVLDEIAGLPASFKSKVAKHLHHALYTLNNKLMVDFRAMKALAEKNIDLSSYLDSFPMGTFLESATILFNSKNWQNFENFCFLFATPLAREDNCSESLYAQGYKLAVLFGGCSQQNLLQFFEKTKTLLPVVQNELRLLITQLFSIDYDKSCLDALSNNRLWDGLISGIETMQNAPSQTAVHRVAFLERLRQAGLHFNYSTSGDYRALTTKEQDGPLDLNFFVDHEERLWHFLQAHIAVPTEPSVSTQDTLQPLMNFFKRLQLNRTYLNEIEPLLSALEKTTSGAWWTADYFNQLVRALTPADERRAFPISLLNSILKVNSILKEPAITGKSLDELDHQFPQALTAIFQAILANTKLTREQQTKICHIALCEFHEKGNTLLTEQILSTFSEDTYQPSRDDMLAILVDSKTINQLKKRFERMVWFYEQCSLTPVVRSNWIKTSTYWLTAVNARENEEKLLGEVQALCKEEPGKQALILHILAYSALRQGLKNDESWQIQLDRKAPRLVKQLANLSEDELVALANLYSTEPSPDAEDLFYFIKQHNNGKHWHEILENYSRHPESEVRREHASLLASTHVDFERLIKDTRLTIAGKKVSLSVEQIARLSLSFTYLKQLENGSVLIEGLRVSEMSRQELIGAFKQLSELAASEPDNIELRLKVWALLFEALGRTTQKYPHLAQQFSIIANDICIGSNSRALQLATGEGKSHYVALRAARFAAMGKTVEICTAKNALVARDYQDYLDLFNYLDLRSCTIDPKSSEEKYLNSPIHYTTLGELSLFLDERSFNGKPIEVAPKNRVILVDELDFVFFEEGLNTSYNYACPTGKTPKQMHWFYVALNAFYSENRDNFYHMELITPANIQMLMEYLLSAANDNLERLGFVHELIREPLELVKWLQSTVEANHLEMGQEFTVREEVIAIGDEPYTLRKIIPLSSDNQKIQDSNFSAGVHQLLAERLNQDAKIKGEPQNHHVPAESYIISSQVASARTRQLATTWEGFSGTLSSVQAHRLYAEHGTEMLHVPTNQADLRHWHKPFFATSSDEWLDAIVRQARDCFNKKQSILLSCKNDKQVADLKERLKNVLTDDEYSQFIFHTNDEHKTSYDVLEDKKKLEAQKSGKKPCPVGLSASGFGRGDNVDVKAVFIFNSNDKNDRIQKGGRTARNGEEGDVFQFYLADDICREQRQLQKELDSLLQSHRVDVDEGLSFQEEMEARFDNLLGLREIVFNLKNQANEGYHHGLANYTNWVMHFLAGLKSPTEKNRLMMAVTRDLQAIENEWLQISSKQNWSTAQKLETINGVFNRIHQEFVDKFASLSALASAFKSEILPTPLKLETEEAGVESQVDTLALKLSLLLIRLTPCQLNQALINQVIANINMLMAGDDNWLGEFLAQAEKARSAEGILDALTLTCQQKTKASAEIKAFRRTLLSPADTFDHLQPGTQGAFLNLYKAFNPKEQQKILLQLQNPKAMVSEEERVQGLLPVMKFLSQFKSEKERAWLDDYFQNIDNLSVSLSPGLCNAFYALHPLNYRHFVALSQLAHTYSLAPDHLQRAIMRAPDARIRMLTTCEAWLRESDFSLDNKSAFLAAFCHIMEQFEEALDWDVFQKLVAMTNARWSKLNGKFKPLLVAAWQALAVNGSCAPHLAKFIDWCMKQPGKRKFELLAGSFELGTDKFLQYYQSITDIWDALDEEPQLLHGKKKIEILQMLFDCLNNRQQPLQSEYILKVLRLTAEPELIRQLLTYKVPVHVDFSIEEKTKRVNSINHTVVDFIKDYEWDKLLSVSELSVLLNELSTISAMLIARGHVEGASIDSLLINCILYLRTLPADQQSLASKLQHYWSLVKDVLQKVNSRTVHIDESDKDMVAKRVILMQFLAQGFFITTGASERPWTVEYNKKIIQVAFVQYAEKMKAVLTAGSKRLTDQQKCVLLEFSHELTMVNDISASSTNSVTSEANQQQMIRGLLSLVDAYQKCLFKSDARVEKANYLTVEINKLLQEDNSAGGCRYQRALVLIHQVKLEVIESDMQLNTKRFFKLNRSGNSRFIDTLNQMHDLVVKNWVENAHSLPKFQQYREDTKNEFKSLTQHFKSALCSHIQDTYEKECASEAQKIMRRLQGFFDKGLCSRLKRLQTMINAEMSVKDSQLLLQQIKSDLSFLPGHLATVAKDVLAQGEALIKHLEQSEPQETQLSEALL